MKLQSREDKDGRSIGQMDIVAHWWRSASAGQTREARTRIRSVVRRIRIWVFPAAPGTDRSDDCSVLKGLE